MQVHRNIFSLPVFKNAVVTIGTFDRVHTGHQEIITQLKQEAAAIDGETVIITFHPHPRKVVSGKKIFILNTLEEKIHPHTVIIGYDHRFGKDRQGDYHLLEDYGKKLGFTVKEIPEHLLHEVIVSSTKIREALLAGDIATANEYLGYDYFFEGTVVEGNKLGRELGYPTANLKIEDAEKLIPGNGIYAVTAEFPVSSFQLPVNTGNQQPASGNKHSGMMSIGVRPTITTDATKRVIEINIFDFDKDIYGQSLRVFVKHYLRAEVKFKSLEELKLQLEKDKEEALSLLK